MHTKVRIEKLFEPKAKLNLLFCLDVQESKIFKFTFDEFEI